MLNFPEQPYQLMMITTVLLKFNYKFEKNRAALTSNDLE